MMEHPGASRAYIAPPPRLRGVLHLAAAMLAPVAVVALLLIADSPRRYVSAAIFASSLLLLYASSASYHLAPWTSRLRTIVQRIDHSMIFVLIAGTYTPFCLVVLDNAWGISMLVAVWSMAGAGVLSKVLWPRAPRWFGVGLYLAAGWMGVIAAPAVITTLSLAPLLLLLLGGGFYTIGAVIYALRRPDPFPRVFGYHEVFHALVVAGSALHFAVLAAYVLPS